MVRPGLILGPGKVELLEAIGRTGSISAKWKCHRRAWLLVSALNEMFGRTLVTTSPGERRRRRRGGVTEFGRTVAGAYRSADERTSAAIREEFARIGQAMKKSRTQRFLCAQGARKGKACPG